MDWPYLLIGSAESTLAVINIKNLPNVRFPKNSDDYHKSSIERFSKFNSSRIIGGDTKRAILGTVDGRCLTLAFKEHNEAVHYTDHLISRTQKKTDTRVSLCGQVNCVDLGYYNYESFSLIGGSEDLSSYNMLKKTKGTTISAASSTIGAATAVRISPRMDFVAFSTGSDWTKGIHELESLRRPRIGVVKLTAGDLKTLTAR